MSTAVLDKPTRKEDLPKVDVKIGFSGDSDKTKVKDAGAKGK